MNIFRIGVILTLAASFALSQESLTNDAVVKMAKAGLSDSVIINLIGQQPGNYSTKVDDLVTLKQAGVSDNVIAAMIAKAAGGPVTPAAAASNAPATAASSSPAYEIGIYYKKPEGWAEVLPEVVNWKTGGTIKSVASAGIVKKDINGNISGPTSRNTVKSPLEFMIVAADGVAITEYQLIRLRLNKDYREFRTVTGGVFNQSSGAMRDLVPFEGKRIAPRTYSVVLPNNLGAGEYGFLAPGAFGASGNAAAQIGKMYTFRIIE
jgi:hypothetical protein